MDAAAQGKGHPALAVSVCLSEGVGDGGFPQGWIWQSAGERRRAELVKGTSREVPQLLCHVKEKDTGNAMVGG